MDVETTLSLRLIPCIEYDMQRFMFTVHPGCSNANAVWKFRMIRECSRAFKIIRRQVLGVQNMVRKFRTIDIFDDQRIWKYSIIPMTRASGNPEEPTVVMASESGNTEN